MTKLDPSKNQKIDMVDGLSYGIKYSKSLGQELNHIADTDDFDVSPMDFSLEKVEHGQPKEDQVIDMDKLSELLASLTVKIIKIAVELNEAIKSVVDAVKHFFDQIRPIFESAWRPINHKKKMGYFTSNRKDYKYRNYKLEKYLTDDVKKARDLYERYNTHRDMRKK